VGITVDDIDWQIINRLRVDARTSFRRIARELGISTHTVIKRYEKLRKEIHLSSGVTVDLRKIGFENMVTFMITTSTAHNMQKTLNELTKVRNVIVATKTIGDCDLLVVAVFTDFEQLFELERRISRISGVSEIEFALSKSLPEWPIDPNLMYYASSQLSSE
jgi:DNA-binding Lrp family transcriptional regulator